MPSTVLTQRVILFLWLLKRSASLNIHFFPTLPRDQRNAGSFRDAVSRFDTAGDSVFLAAAQISKLLSVSFFKAYTGRVDR